MSARNPIRMGVVVCAYTRGRNLSRPPEIPAAASAALPARSVRRVKDLAISLTSYLPNPSGLRTCRRLLLNGGCGHVPPARREAAPPAQRLPRPDDARGRVQDREHQDDPEHR